MCSSDREKQKEEVTNGTSDDSSKMASDMMNTKTCDEITPQADSTQVDVSSVEVGIVEEEKKDFAPEFEHQNVWTSNKTPTKRENDFVDNIRTGQDKISDQISLPILPERRDSIEKTISEIDSSCEGYLPDEDSSEHSSKTNNPKSVCDVKGPQEKMKKDAEVETSDEIVDGKSWKNHKIHPNSLDRLEEDGNKNKRETGNREAQQLEDLKQNYQHQQQRMYQHNNETTTAAPQVSSQTAGSFSNMDVHGTPHPLVVLPAQHMGGVMLPHMQAPTHYIHHPHQASPPVQLPTMFANGGPFVMDHNSFVDHNAFVSQHHQQLVVPPQHQNHQPRTQQPFRKRVILRLVEKQETTIHGGKKSIFSILKRPKSRSMGSGEELLDDCLETMQNIEDNKSPQRMKKYARRGEVTVSWYEGTTAVELQDHVRKSVERKVRLGEKQTMVNLRVLDESVEPFEEIVLSPFIPDGSKFLVTFRIKDNSSNVNEVPHHHRAPPSPSAAPSPPGELEQELQKQISEVLQKTGKEHRIKTKSSGSLTPSMSEISTPKRSQLFSESISNVNDATDQRTKRKGTVSESLSMNDMNSIVPMIHDNDANDSILAKRLEELNTSLLRLHNDGQWSKDDPTYKKTEKKQVVFVLANYFVLFLSLIAISAEIHERAPTWIEYINENVTSVQNCAMDRDALFECVSEGNFSGLIASFILWASQSVATKRLFLFGFDSPGKLWTVVYEAGVTALCWGTSYLAIRRGLNPDTRPNCLRKYWKDAVYGSLAGFNAAFMKAVLKNLLPKADEVFDVMEGRQLHLVKQLGKLFKAGTEM